MMFSNMIILLLVILNNPSLIDTACLTWSRFEKGIQLICSVDTLGEKIYLIGNTGEKYTECKFQNIISTCEPFNASFIDRERLEVRFNIETDYPFTYDGVWKCKQGNNVYQTNVTSRSGIIDSTKMKIDIVNLSNSSIKVICSSCREPFGNNVEFMIDGVSVDSISYSKTKRKCFHETGDCKPDVCTCSMRKHEFSRIFPVQGKWLHVSYGCDIIFTDDLTEQRFSINASVRVDSSGRQDISYTYHIKRKGRQPVELYNMSAIQTTSSPKENKTYIQTDTSSKPSLGLTWIALTVAVALILIGTVCIIRCRYIENRRKFVDHESQPGTESQETTEYRVKDNGYAVDEVSVKKPLINHKSQPSTRSQETTDYRDHESQPGTESQETREYRDYESQPSTKNQEMTEYRVKDDSYAVNEVSVQKPFKGTMYDHIGMESPSSVRPLCDICKELYRTRPAMTMYICCEESMCFSCKHTHSLMKQSRDHNFVNIEKVPKGFTIPLTCRKHSNKIVYFCKNHEVIGCRTCLIESNTEECEFEVIDDQSKGFRDSQFFSDHSVMVQTYCVIVSSLNLHLYIKIDSLNKNMTNSKSCCNAVQTANDDFSISKDTGNLEEFAKKTEDYTTYINNHIEYLDFTKKYGTEKQLFILAYSSNEAFQDMREEIYDIVVILKKLNLAETVMSEFLSLEQIDDKQSKYRTHSQLCQSQVAVTKL